MTDLTTIDDGGLQAPRRDARPVGHSELVKAFLDRKNPGTVRAYKLDLDMFRAWLEEEIAQPVDTIEEAAKILFSEGRARANFYALCWKQSLEDPDRGRPLQPATINRRLSALRSLANLAERLGVVEWTLIVDNVPHKAYRDTSGPGLEGVLKILEVLDAQEAELREASKDLKFVRRNRALVYLLFVMALRRNEVHLLDLSDVDFQRGKLRILGKGRHGERELVTMPDEVGDVIVSWLASRGEAPGPLFVNYDPAEKGERDEAGQRDDRLRAWSINRIVGDLGIAAGIQQPVTAHGLRHAGVEAGLDVTGGDVRSGAARSRHSKIETLMIYDQNRRDMGGEVSRKVAALLKRKPGGEAE